MGSNTDRSDESGFRAASASKVWYGTAYFRRGSEPYIATAVAGRQPDAGVVIADINLKFVRDVVSAIRLGKAGHAYVVDARGRLISHPDMSLVLKMSDLSALPQAQAALSQSGRGDASVQTVIAKDVSGSWTLTAYAPIEALSWTILVEQPLAEAFAPLLSSAARSGLVLLLGIALAVAASLVLARQMVAPIRTLEALPDISKLDAGNMALQLVEFALQPMLERLEQAFALAAQAKGLRLRVRPTRVCVATDPVLLECILLNLAANAVRYTWTGGVLIGVRQRGGRAAIEVWDTGVGIAPEEHKHIFEEFYRLPGGGADSAKGLGLGLAIVDRLAWLLDIPFSVSSAAGHGSKFSVSVTLAHGAVAEAPPHAPAATTQAIRLDGMRVLLFDKAARLRALLHHVFSNARVELINETARPQSMRDDHSGMTAR